MAILVRYCLAMVKAKRIPKGSLQGHPSFLLSQLGFHSDKRFNEQLVPFGVNARQFGVLRILADAEWQSQQQLAGALGIHRNVMVGIVDELERRNLVERRRHPADRRAHAIHLTAAARKLVPRVEAILDACDDELLGVLSPAERRTIIELMQRVADGAGLVAGLHPGYKASDSAT